MRSSNLRIALSSSGSESALRWAWALTIVLIVAAGWLLYALRSSVAPAVDRWLPNIQRTPEVVTDPLDTPASPAPKSAEPERPAWAYVDIENALRPLPKATKVLVAEGLDELSEFSGLDSTNETRALLIRNRWRLWGRIWRNRVNQLEGRLPPLEDCEVHAALEPTCRALASSLAALQQVPEAEHLEAAKERFAQASETLEELLNPPIESADKSSEDSILEGDPGTDEE